MTLTVDMITSQGHPVWFLEPEKTPVDVRDLKTHTRNMCRYSGALEWHLVKHLALCVKLAEDRYGRSSKMPRIAAYCAAHDLHEIYVTDVVSGLKKYLPEFRKIESSWEEYVHEEIGLPWDHRPSREVKFIDERALVLEMTFLGHPAADLIQRRHGGPPRPNEELVFTKIHAHTRPACWGIVWRAIQKVQKEFV